MMELRMDGDPNVCVVVLQGDVSEVGRVESRNSVFANCDICYDRRTRYAQTQNAYRFVGADVQQMYMHSS
jgi:hypothetical protein